MNTCAAAIQVGQALIPYTAMARVSAVTLSGISANCRYITNLLPRRCGVTHMCLMTSARRMAATRIGTVEGRLPPDMWQQICPCRCALVPRSENVRLSTPWMMVITKKVSAKSDTNMFYTGVMQLAVQHDSLGARHISCRTAHVATYRPAWMHTTATIKVQE